MAYGVEEVKFEVILVAEHVDTMYSQQDGARFS
jgi:hypothetical protein